MKKLKQLLKESHIWERKFGEKLPTLADIQKKKNDESKIVKESTKKWAVKVAEVGTVIVDAGSAMEAKKMVARKLRGGMKDILDITKALPSRKVATVGEGGPGSGPHGDDEDNPFDKEPSDDDLANIEKEFEGKVNEAISLKDIEGGIFDSIVYFNKMVKKHPVAKKNRKIAMIIKQMYKLESQLGDEVGELD